MFPVSTLLRTPWGRVKEFDQAAREWVKLARACERFFPGYRWTAVSPSIVLRPEDRPFEFHDRLVQLSPDAAISLTGMTEDEAAGMPSQQSFAFDLSDVEADR